MASYKINQLSTYAYKILETHKIGTVHSVYRKTINLEFDGQLIALQAEGSPLSPISLITNMTQEDMKKLNISANQEVQLSGQEIHFTTDLSYAGINPIDLSLTGGLRKEELDQLRTSIYKAIQLANTGGFDLIFSNSEEIEGNLIMPAARNRLMKITELLSQSAQIEHITEELIHLIGLGIGLTPSGDDFLTGILAGLILSGKDCSLFTIMLKQEIRKHLSDTNDISGAFLTCALSGEFSQSVLSLKETPSQTPIEILENFLKIGHSSGVDTLCGIYFSLKYFCDV